jgi:hypothetical protein
VDKLEAIKDRIECPSHDGNSWKQCMEDRLALLPVVEAAKVVGDMCARPCIDVRDLENAQNDLVDALAELEKPDDLLRD